MSKFGYLADTNVTAENTAIFSVTGIMVNGKTPKLTVKPATEANPPYFNVRLKQASKNQKGSRRRLSAVDADTLAESRDMDRALYPKHVIVDWENVIDGETGNAVKFSEAECADFLKVLPDWQFDDLRLFCDDPANFVDALDIDITAKK